MIKKKKLMQQANKALSINIHRLIQLPSGATLTFFLFFEHHLLAIWFGEAVAFWEIWVLCLLPEQVRASPPMGTEIESFLSISVVLEAVQTALVRLPQLQNMPETKNRQKSRRR